jgi:hypothetical protein
VSNAKKALTNQKVISIPRTLSMLFRKRRRSQKHRQSPIARKFSKESKQADTHSVPNVFRDFVGSRITKLAQQAIQHLKSNFQDLGERRFVLTHVGRRFKIERTLDGAVGDLVLSGRVV